jgi:acyl-CoA thioester hydrolase
VQSATIPIDVRYLEADQQGVVFNMWYLAYFEDARNALFAQSGFALHDLLAGGHDIQLVHTELDWAGAARWPDRLEVSATVAHLGRTSLTIDFAVGRASEVLVTGRTVYVIVARDGSGKRPIPAGMRAALGGEPVPVGASLEQGAAS